MAKFITVAALNHGEVMLLGTVPGYMTLLATVPAGIVAAALRAVTREVAH